MMGPSRVYYKVTLNSKLTVIYAADNNDWPGKFHRTFLFYKLW